jgi:hypothetical protein
VGWTDKSRVRTRPDVVLPRVAWTAGRSTPTNRPFVNETSTYIMLTVHRLDRTEMTQRALEAVCVCGLRVVFPDSIDVTMGDVRRGISLATGHLHPDSGTPEAITLLADFRVDWQLPDIRYYVRCLTCGWSTRPLPFEFASDARRRHGCSA